MPGMIGILALAAATAPAAAPEAAAPSTAIVFLADGTQFPLLGWVLSYEFVSGGTGEMPTKSARRDVHELRVGPRRHAPRDHVRDDRAHTGRRYRRADQGDGPTRLQPHDHAERQEHQDAAEPAGSEVPARGREGGGGAPTDRRHPRRDADRN